MGKESQSLHRRPGFSPQNKDPLRKCKKSSSFCLENPLEQRRLAGRTVDFFHAFSEDDVNSDISIQWDFQSIPP